MYRVSQKKVIVRIRPEQGIFGYHYVFSCRKQILHKIFYKNCLLVYGLILFLGLPMSCFHGQVFGSQQFQEQIISLLKVVPGF